MRNLLEKTLLLICIYLILRFLCTHFSGLFFSLLAALIIVSLLKPLVPDGRLHRTRILMAMCLFYLLLILPLIALFSTLLHYGQDFCSFLLYLCEQTKLPAFSIQLFTLFSNELSSLFQETLLLIRSLLTSLPDFLLLIFIHIFTVFYLLKEDHKLQDRLPDNLSQSFHNMLQATRTLFLIDLKLTLITFLILSISFFLLQFSHPLLCALMICLFDLLPLVGCALILLPWSLILFASQHGIAGFFLLLITLIIFLLRTMLENRWLSESFTIHPLLLLITMLILSELFGMLSLFFAPQITLLIQNHIKN